MGRRPGPEDCREDEGTDILNLAAALNTEDRRNEQDRAVARGALCQEDLKEHRRGHAERKNEWIVSTRGKGDWRVKR